MANVGSPVHFLRRLLQNASRLTLILTGLCIAAIHQPANALGFIDPAPGPWSFEKEKGCDHFFAIDCYLWILDPPTSATQVGFTMHYDSSKMTIFPSESGFLCDFSDGGSCPLTAPGTSGNNGASIHVGGPRPGTTYTFAVTPDTITLNYGLSANPAPLGPDQNFFAIAFSSPFPVVVFETQPMTGDIFQISTSCQTIDPVMSCKSDHPISGATLMVPEPETYALMLAGLGALGFVARRRKPTHRLP